MMQWYAPIDMRAWGRRLIALRTVLPLGMLCILVASEFYADWCERMVGSYLVSTNGARPQSGAIWDQGRQADSARQVLSQYTSELQGAQREARQATSLGQVVAGIEGDQGAMISAAHFIELYLKLPPVLSHEIISPYTLLVHLSRGEWRRTFFEQQDQQLAVYFLDGQNQVLHRMVVGPGLLEHIQSGEVAIQTSLYQLADFAAHIYPAVNFFSALNSLSAAERKGVIAHPDELLRVSGRLVRVGISSQTMAGTIDVGFEVEDMHGAKVILMQGRQADVQQLQWLLETQTYTAFPAEGEEARP
jgi:hypothetical protein